MTPPQSAPRSAREPFDTFDELVWASERRGAPIHMQLEVRIRADLETAALDAALAHASDCHPKATATLVPPRAHHRSLFWELGAPVSARLLHGALDDARDGGARRPIDLTAGPAVRAEFLAGSPGSTHLLFGGHHGALDGMSLQMFAEDTLSHLFGMIGADLRHKPGSHDEWPEALSTTTSQGSPSTGLTTVIGALRSIGGATKPTRIAAEGATSGPGQSITNAQTAAAVVTDPESRWPGTTVNDQLVAALHLAVDAWNTTHGRASESIRVSVPLNLRPPGGRAFGNHTGLVSTESTANLRSEPAALLASIHDTVDLARQQRREDPAAALLGGALPVGLRRHVPRLGAMVTGDRALDTVRLSNLGALGGGAWDGRRVTGAWFSPPTRMPQGAAVGVTGIGDDLYLSLRSCSGLLGRDGAGSFMALYVDTLGNLVQV